MADSKISNLPEVTTLIDADLITVVHAGVTDKITLQNAKATLKGDKGDTGNTGAVSTVAGPQGTAGEEVLIQVSGGYIQWKYTNDVSWTNLIAVSTLVGATGATGTEVELQKTATYIQWRLVGGSWANLVALADIKGDQGIQGIQGITGNNGVDAYVYIAYASDASGTDFTLTFDAALNYIAVKHTTTTIASPVASDFTGLWKNYKGATGAPGVGTGDVLGPASNSADYIPQWNGTNSKTLKGGVAVPAGGLAGLTALGDKVDKVTGSRLITSAESTILGNTSGANSGDSATPAETTTTVGALINGATGKTSAVDADYLPLMDSQASNLMKKLSWAYVKSILKTYFDGLYTLANLGGLGLHATADDSSKAGGYSVNPTPTANNIPVLDANALLSSAWIEVLGGVGFQNSWTNYGGAYATAAYAKDIAGVIHFKGTIKSGTVGQAAFTLPTGYRPGASIDIVVNSNGAFGVVEITSAGIVNPVAGNNAYFFLDGISFKI
jgi:hypothetical protein